MSLVKLRENKFLEIYFQLFLSYHLDDDSPLNGHINYEHKFGEIIEFDDLMSILRVNEV